MKKVLIATFVATFLFWSCDTDNLESQIPQEEQQRVDLGVDSGELSRIAANTTGRQCHSMNVLARQLEENPGMLQRMQNIESHTRLFEKNLMEQEMEMGTEMVAETQIQIQII